MAATLTPDGELTYISFPIAKTERTPDGDVIIYGKATDGRVDSDGQIVDPIWAAKAIKEWLGSGANIRVQHNPMRDPAGIGLDVDDDGRGGQWVKALIVEPIAKDLVLKGVLRSYSVGIMHPLVVPDPVAPNGRITDGELGELSLVDRPANKGCRYELVTKGEKGPVLSGHLYGDPISPANPMALAQRERLNKSADMEITAFTGKRAGDTEKGSMANDTDDTVEKAGDADCDLCEGKGKIRGGKVTCPECKGTTKAAAVKVDDAALVKGGGDEDDDNSGGDGSVADDTAPEDSVDNDEDESGGEKKPADKDEGKAEKSAKKSGATCAKCSGMMKAKNKFCPGCGAKAPDIAKAAKPTPDRGVTGDRDPAVQPVPGHREPDGDAVEAFEADAGVPTDPDASFKALLVFKGLGIDADLGALHDLLCPAYHPAAANKAHPHASVSGLDVGEWHSVAMDAATMGTMEQAQESAGLWKGASLLAATPEEQLTDLRYQLHKAFQDANPGPGTAPTPGAITPGRFNRPYVAAGNARHSFQYEAPNTAPMIAGQVTPGQFTRGYLATGTADNSPANGGAGRPVVPPSGVGIPTPVNTAAMTRGNAAQSMLALHDHVSRRFPDICPMRAPGDDGGTPANVGAVSAVGKTAKPVDKKPAKKRAKSEVAAEALPVEAAPAAVNKAVTVDSGGVEALVKLMAPDLVKAAVFEAVAEAQAPLLAKLDKQKAVIKALKERVDGMADEADPRDAPWRGMLPGNPAATKALIGSASPVSYGPQQIAERSQLVVMQDLEERWRDSNDPSEREATWKQVMAMRGINIAD